MWPKWSNRKWTSFNFDGPTKHTFHIAYGEMVPDPVEYNHEFPPKQILTQGYVGLLCIRIRFVWYGSIQSAMVRSFVSIRKILWLINFWSNPLKGKNILRFCKCIERLKYHWTICQILHHSLICIQRFVYHFCFPRLWTSMSLVFDDHTHFWWCFHCLCPLSHFMQTFCLSGLMLLCRFVERFRFCYAYCYHHVPLETFVKSIKWTSHLLCPHEICHVAYNYSLWMDQ